MTIRGKFGLVLLIIFIISLLSFNIFIDKLFEKNFKNIITEDVKIIYSSSIKNLEDYILLNNIKKDSLTVKDLNNKLINFIVDRIGCEGVIYNLDKEVIAIGIKNEKQIDLNKLYKIPNSFDLVKDNKTVVDIEEEGEEILGKLSYSIYGKESEPIGIIVLIKDYSSEFIRNNNTKNLVNTIVSIMFILILTSVYYLSSNIVKPIIILKDKLSEISKGKYPNKIEVKSRDEIGVLVNSFNIMSEKLKKKDEQEKSFFRNVTHELKTPLTNISGYAQILEDENFDDIEFRKKALNRIISESNRMHDMVFSLLNISKQSSDLEEYNYEKINLKNIINELLDIRTLDLKGKNLKINFSSKDHILIGNKQYIKILFSNLIDNAIKYSSKETTIKIKLEEINEFIQFSILSKGKVIPVDLKDKIFEAFVRVENKGFSSKNSNGLGLYICKNIIAAHGGLIELNLNKDESEFIVKLPKG
ncbi:MAG: HAMP domain-containing histidine kinase [Clostridiales bacterium]|nr:HAMP domain-containing histidine kinase [Clostridiales bacterium]